MDAEFGSTLSRYCAVVVIGLSAARKPALPSHVGRYLWGYFHCRYQRHRIGGILISCSMLLTLVSASIAEVGEDAQPGQGPRREQHHYRHDLALEAANE
jgi:hypothetical protein